MDQMLPRKAPCQVKHLRHVNHCARCCLHTLSTHTSTVCTYLSVHALELAYPSSVLLKLTTSLFLAGLALLEAERPGLAAALLGPAAAIYLSQQLHLTGDADRGASTAGDKPGSVESLYSSSASQIAGLVKRCKAHALALLQQGDACAAAQACVAYICQLHQVGVAFLQWWCIHLLHSLIGSRQGPGKGCKPMPSTAKVSWPLP